MPLQFLHGEGVAAVWKKIEDAFRDVRTNARIDTDADTSEKRIKTVEEAVLCFWSGLTRDEREDASETIQGRSLESH